MAGFGPLWRRIGGTSCDQLRKDSWDEQPTVTGRPIGDRHTTYLPAETENQECREDERQRNLAPAQTGQGKPPLLIG